MGEKQGSLKVQGGVESSRSLFISPRGFELKMKIEIRLLTVSIFLLNLPLGWICCLAGDHFAIFLSLLTFYAVKGPVAWILYLRPKLKLPTCVFGICLTCSGTLWYAEWSSNYVTDLLRYYKFKRRF